MSALEREAVASPRPSQPYRGIEEFRFVDEPIFFGRTDELRVLMRLVTMYRGVLLFGDSGAGKSSLINAGLLPDLVHDQYAPERIRVQPVPGGEFIVERVPTADNPDGPFLPSIFSDGGAGRRITLSAAQFAARLDEARSSEICTLLVFDQFEELVTLTEQALRDRQGREEAEGARDAITRTLMQLLRKNELNLKMLFVFREDYYARLSRFFAGYPNLSDHYFRLEALRTDDLAAMIQGPFKDSHLVFERPLPDAVMKSLEAEFRERSATDFVSLTEVQIASLRLWNAKDPEALLKSAHVNGLLEGYFSEATQSIRSSLRTAALAILWRLVTSSGTRNVVSFDTLMAQLVEDGIERPMAEAALKALEETARVVRKEARNDVVIYELVSEFLVPWIRRQRIEARVGERERKWIAAFAVACGVALIIILLVILRSTQRSVSATEKRLAAASAALDEKADQLDAANDQIKTLKDQLEDSKKEQTRLLEERDKADVARVAAEADSHRAQEQVGGLVASLKSVRLELEASKQQAAQLAAQVKTESEARMVADVAKTGVEAKLHAVTTERDQYKKELELASTELAKLRSSQRPPPKKK